MTSTERTLSTILVVLAIATRLQGQVISNPNNGQGMNDADNSAGMNQNQGGMLPPNNGANLPNGARPVPGGNQWSWGSWDSGRNERWTSEDSYDDWYDSWSD